MHSRPLAFLGRTLLAGCAVGLGASVVLGQSSSPAPAAPAQTQTPASRADVFMGYSYLDPHGSVTTTVRGGATASERYSPINEGAIGSFAWYFNRYVGGQIEFAVHPDGSNDGIGSGEGGIIFRYPTGKVTPFVHGLAGAVDIGGPNYHVAGYRAGDTVFHKYTIGPALTAGVGMDFEITKRFAWRIAQADFVYYHADFGPQAYGGAARTSLRRS